MILYLKKLRMLFILVIVYHRSSGEAKLKYSTSFLDAIPTLNYSFCYFCMYRLQPIFDVYVHAPLPPPLPRLDLLHREIFWFEWWTCESNITCHLIFTTDLVRSLWYHVVICRVNFYPLDSLLMLKSKQFSTFGMLVLYGFTIGYKPKRHISQLKIGYDIYISMCKCCTVCSRHGY